MMQGHATELHAATRRSGSPHDLVRRAAALGQAVTVATLALATVGNREVLAVRR
jgi:hypothetical protein